MHRFHKDASSYKALLSDLLNLSITESTELALCQVYQLHFCSAIRFLKVLEGLHASSTRAIRLIATHDLKSAALSSGILALQARAFVQFTFSMKNVLQ
jgi:hypothetical protein